VALTSVLRDRLRRSRKDDTKPPVSAAASGASQATKSTDNSESVDGQEYSSSSRYQPRVQIIDDSASQSTLQAASLVRASSFASSTASSTENPIFLDHEAVKKVATDSVTEASDGSEEEPEGYSDFCEILRAETSGQHSQVSLK
jgi:hypothetical protein